MFKINDRAAVEKACSMIVQANAVPAADVAVFSAAFRAALLGDEPLCRISSDADADAWNWGEGAARHYYPADVL